MAFLDPHLPACAAGRDPRHKILLDRGVEKVFDLLLKRDKINESIVEHMLAWRHSGFGIHRGPPLAEGDTAGVERIAPYMLRCPFSLQRLICVTDQGQVIYRAETRDCRSFPKPASASLFGDAARNFQVFDLSLLQTR